MARKSNKANDKISLTVCLVIVLAATFAECMNYDFNKAQHNDLFSAAIGLVGWFGMFFHSQRIIDNNLFKRFAIVGLAIFCISVLKQYLTFFSLLSLFAAGLPLLFVGFFRVLTFLFFQDYPIISRTPTIVFSSKHGMARVEGIDEGYKPTMKERVFSLLLFMGFMAFAFCIILLLKNLM